jgi:hypothetical protein
VIFSQKNWVKSCSTNTARKFPRHWIMMGRVLEMQDNCAFHCVILITALDTQVKLLSVVRGGSVS